MNSLHDVLIVGAGPAGSALAYFLAANGLSVQLVDKAQFPRDKTCGDALSPRALHILKNMGLFESVKSVGFSIRRVAFFAPDGSQVIVPMPAYENLPDFSVILPRQILDDMLRLHAMAAGAAFQSQVTVVDVLRKDDLITGVRANTPDGPVEFHARLTIFATGAAYSLLERTHLLHHTPDFSRAARAYYEGVGGLSDMVEFHYDSVPLPAYGWVFPTSATSANIGAGLYVPPGAKPAKNSPRQVMDEFITNSHIAEMLKDARPTSPIKGYPLRFDFPQAQIAFPGLFLVGEACGLVNPLTGEGIDYALESAELAADVLLHAIRQSEAPQLTMQRYTQRFRARFLTVYKSLIQVQKLYMRRWMMNRYISVAQRNDDLALLLANIGLGNVDPLKALSPKNLLQIVLG